MSTIATTTRVYFFVYRKGSPAGFQLMSRDICQQTNHVTVGLKNPTEIPWDGDATWKMTWSPTLGTEESPLLSKCVEHATRLMLVNRHNPQQRYRICLLRSGTVLPARGSREIPIHSRLHNTTLNKADGSGVYTIADLINPDHVRGWGPPRAAPPVAPAAPSAPAASAPQIRTVTRTVIKALPIFTATILVKALMERGEECPIEMEALSSFDNVLVAHCGHACGPSASRLTCCPVCREECTWTSVPTY